MILVLSSLSIAGCGVAPKACVGGARQGAAGALPERCRGADKPLPCPVAVPTPPEGAARRDARGVRGLAVGAPVGMPCERAGDRPARRLRPPAALPVSTIRTHPSGDKCGRGASGIGSSGRAGGDRRRADVIARRGCVRHGRRLVVGLSLGQEVEVGVVGKAMVALPPRDLTEEAQIGELRDQGVRVCDRQTRQLARDGHGHDRAMVEPFQELQPLPGAPAQTRRQGLVEEDGREHRQRRRQPRLRGAAAARAARAAGASAMASASCRRVAGRGARLTPRPRSLMARALRPARSAGASWDCPAASQWRRRAAPKGTAAAAIAASAIPRAPPPRPPPA